MLKRFLLAILALSVALAACAPEPLPPEPSRLNLAPVMTAGDKFCTRENDELAGMTRDGCAEGLRRLETYVAQGMNLEYRSLEECLAVVRDIRQQAQYINSDHALWCRDTFPNLHDRKGCRDAAEVFFKHFEPDAFCRQDAHDADDAHDGISDADIIAPPALHPPLFPPPASEFEAESVSGQDLPSNTAPPLEAPVQTGFIQSEQKVDEPRPGRMPEERREQPAAQAPSAAVPPAGSEKKTASPSAEGKAAQPVTVPPDKAESGQPAPWTPAGRLTPEALPPAQSVTPGNAASEKSAGPDGAQQPPAPDKIDPAQRLAPALMPKLRDLSGVPARQTQPADGPKPLVLPTFDPREQEGRIEPPGFGPGLAPLVRTGQQNAADAPAGPEPLREPPLRRFGDDIPNFTPPPPPPPLVPAPLPMNGGPAAQE